MESSFEFKALVISVECFVLLMYCDRELEYLVLGNLDLCLFVGLYS